MLLAEEGRDMDEFKALNKPMMVAAFGPGADGEPDGCAFACHNVDDRWQTDNKSLYQHAVENGITLRIHRVVDGAKSVLAATYRDDNETARIGIVDFGEIAQTTVAPTRDTRALRTALDRDIHFPLGATHYDRVVEHVVAQFGPSGTGRSQNNTRKLAVLITDGAYSHTPTYDFNDMVYTSMDPAVCDGLKDAGYTVAVLNTRYDPLRNSVRYDGIIAPYVHLLPPALRDCASPDLYFEVGSGGDIRRAFRDLAEDIAPNPVLRLVD